MLAQALGHPVRACEPLRPKSSESPHSPIRMCTFAGHGVAPCSCPVRACSHKGNIVNDCISYGTPPQGSLTSDPGGEGGPPPRVI